MFLDLRENFQTRSAHEGQQNVLERLREAIERPRDEVVLSRGNDGALAIVGVGDNRVRDGDYILPPIYPERLGDQTFCEAHGCRFAYVTGEMARGIATPRMVIEAVRMGGMGFYGSAGLAVGEVRDGVAQIKAGVGQSGAWGANLIHAPQEPGQEKAIVDLFLAEGVRRMSASAFMKITPEIVRYSATGLTLAADGSVERANHVFAKVSRAELAQHFMSPAPERMLRELKAAEAITEHEAELASRVPIAAEITAEADSGGHTDNRPAAVLFTSLAETRARMAQSHGFPESSVRIGLAGGIATPQSVAAAFQMGAAYVLTGSINQSAVESGLSAEGRRMLAAAGPADVAMAPAADMFEQGVEVQVLKRGTLFAMRGRKFYALYRSGAAFETLSEADRNWVEDVLGEPFEAAWSATREYIRRVNPREADKAEADGNKRFALVARRYLFQGAQWAREGVAARRADFQIWCGPAMGAFNEWVAGSPLEPVEARSVRQIGLNLLEGAARVTRAAQLRAAGLAVPASLFRYIPRIFA